MTFQTVKLDRNPDGTVVLTLNRPAVLNSLNQQMIAEVRAALADVARSDDAHVLIMTGAGRAFCAGADLGADAERELGMSIGEGIYRSMDRSFNPLVRELAALPKPVVAAVNGVAAGGGVGLALAADIVVAARCGGVHPGVRPAAGARARHGLHILPRPVARPGACPWPGVARRAALGPESGGMGFDLEMRR